MVLTKKEKCTIMISRAMSLYSMKLQEGKHLEYQSLIDCVLKNMPQELRSEVTMELIDDVFGFVSDQHMELS